MLANLPTDNFFKVLFFAGLALLVLLFTLDDGSWVEYEKTRDNLRAKQIEHQFEIMKDSANLSIVRFRLDSINSLSKDTSKFSSTNALRTRLLKSEKILKADIIKRLNVSSRHEQTIDGKFDDFADDDVLLIFVILGMGGITIGGIFWGYFQYMEYKMGIKKIQKEIKEYPCQSCGMLLRHDSSAFVEMEYCSSCYNGSHFTEDLTLELMKEKIKSQMEHQKIQKRYIKEHLAKLTSLKRWSKELRWDLNNIKQLEEK